MKTNTIVAIAVVSGVAVGGVILYKKLKAPAAPVVSAGAKPTTANALSTAVGSVASSAANDFLSWLTGPGTNTASQNSTSGTPQNNSYIDTGLNWL